MPRGTVTTFDAARGSGTVRLEDGDEVHFDLSISNTNTSAVRVGATAEVFAGTNRAGKRTAKVVLFDGEDSAGQPFVSALERLRAVGLLSGLSTEIAGKSLGAAPQTLTRELAGALFIAYYGSCRGKGVSPESLEDRVVCLDEHFNAALNLPIADLLALAPPERRQNLRAATKGMHPGSLATTLAALNGVLQDLGAAQRYFLLDIDSDVFAVVAVRDEDFALTVRSTVVHLAS